MMLSKLINWYFSKRTLPLWCIFIMDCLVVLFSDLVVYALTNGVNYTAQHFGHVFWASLFYLIFYIIGFRIFHTYSGVIRYSSFVDLQRVGFAMMSGLAMIAFMKYVCNSDAWLYPFRMRDLMVSALMATVIMWAMRVVVKVMYDTTFRIFRSTPVFIYGTKDGGVGLAKSIRSNTMKEYDLAGFISDGQDMPGHLLMGVRVYANGKT